MVVNLSRLTTGTMNVNAGHERTSKNRIIHQIQPIKGITHFFIKIINTKIKIYFFPTMNLFSEPL